MPPTTENGTMKAIFSDIIFYAQDQSVIYTGDFIVKRHTGMSNWTVAVKLDHTDLFFKFCRPKHDIALRIGNNEAPSKINYLAAEFD